MEILNKSKTKSSATFAWLKSAGATFANKATEPPNDQNLKRTIKIFRDQNNWLSMKSMSKSGSLYVVHHTFHSVHQKNENSPFWGMRRYKMMCIFAKNYLVN